MGDDLLTANQLKFLWKSRGNKNYELERVVINGTLSYVVFEDLQNRRKVLGKIVRNPREGEAYHWPRLQHENLAPLLDTVSINEMTSIYLLPVIGLNLKVIIHDETFMMDSQSFNRKRAYVEDILLALDYLHNKAILCDFQSVHLLKRAKKEDLEIPILYKAPELKTEYFDPISAETWACGVMFLQIFTRDMLPSAFVGEEVQSVLQAVQEINYDIISEANPGAQINLLMIEELKSFLDLFLVEDPKQRVDIQKAAVSTFLSGSRRLEVSNDFKSTSWRPNNKYTPYWKYDKPKWMNSSYKKHLVSPFEDIYLKEVASCKNKFKNFPSTNKFINLKFVPHGDVTTKRSEQNKSAKNKKTCMTEVKTTVKESRSSASHFKPKSNERRVGDIEVISTGAKMAENFKSSDTLKEANKPDLEKISNHFGDVTDNTVKSEVDHGVAALHKMEDAIKSPVNDGNLNETECADTHQLSADSHISLDSLEYPQNSQEQVCDTCANLESVSHDCEKPCKLKLDSKAEQVCAATDGTSSHFKVEYLNSDFKTKDVEQNFASSRQSCSNLSTNNSIERSNDLDFSTSIKNNDRNSSQSRDAEKKHSSDIVKSEAKVTEIQVISQNVADDTTTLGNSSDQVDIAKSEAKATETQVISQNIAVDITTLSNSGDIVKPEAKITETRVISQNITDNTTTLGNSSDTVKSEAKVTETQVISQNITDNTTTLSNQEWKAQKRTLTPDEIYFQSDKNNDVKDRGNLFSFNKSTKEDKTQAVSRISSQNHKQGDHQLRRNNSYEKAISDAQKDPAEHETKKESKSGVGKRKSLLSFSFFSKRTSVMRKKGVVKSGSEGNASSLDNNQDSQNTSNMKERLLEDRPVKMPEKDGKCKSRNWIRYFLCAGSK